MRAVIVVAACGFAAATLAPATARADAQTPTFLTSATAGSATFALTAQTGDTVGAFECSLDGTAFVSCGDAPVIADATTVTYDNLCDGAHSLAARIDLDGTASAAAPFTTSGKQTPCISAITGSAADLSTTGATLAGSVTIAGAPASYHFELSDGAAATETAETPVATAGPLQVSVGSLAPATTYTYRLVVADADKTGVYDGGLRTFTTLAPPSDPPTTTTAPSTAPAQTTTPTPSGTIVTTVVDRGIIGTARLIASLQPEVVRFARTLDHRNPRKLAGVRSFKPKFTWLVPGKVEVLVTVPRATAKKAGVRIAKGKTLSVARGVGLRSGSGSAVVVTKLTIRGRALLKRLRRVPVTVTAIFTPWGGAPVAGQRPAALRR